jgi:hypothetical protein
MDIDGDGGRREFGLSGQRSRQSYMGAAGVRSLDIAFPIKKILVCLRPW